MLDGLEAADGPAELHADLCILDAHVEALLRAADLFGRERDRREVEHALEHLPTVTVGAEQRRRRVVEFEPCLLARLIHRLQRGSGQPCGVGIDGEQRDTLARAGGHDDQVCDMPVEHIHLVAIERPAVARRGGDHSDAGLVPPTVVFGERQGGNGGARRDAGQVLFLRRIVTTVHQRIRGEDDGREVGRAQERSTHLFEHDDQLDVRKPGAAEFLGNDEPLQTHLIGHLAPDRVVEAHFGRHHCPHCLFIGLVVEELAHDAP